MFLSTHGILRSKSALPVFPNNYSLDFDGINDYVSIPSISFSGEFTISAWVKFTTLSSSESHIINTGTSNSNRVGVANSTNFQVKATGTNVYFNETGGNDFVTNQWQHVLVTRDSSNNISVFRNGSSFGGSITLSNTLTLDSIFRFNSTQYALGSCDEFALWSSDQSANIGSIYSASGAVDLSILSPISWYRCGDGDVSPILTDNGSGGNDGTMQNFTTFSTDVP